MMKTRNAAPLFTGLVVRLEQMEVEIGEKGWHLFQIVRHPGSAAVLPLHDDGTVTLIRQLRPSLGAFTLEIPAGRLSPGELPYACGLRELAEETGLVAGNLESLGMIYPSPGFLDEVIHLYIATGLSQGASAPEEYEQIEMVRLPVEEARAMAADGRITDGKTIIALFRAGGRIG